MPRQPTAGPEVDGDCSVLVISCDRYRDLWQPFFALFARYWPDCPFPIYLGSNFADAAQPGVTTLHAGADISWSSNLRLFLEQIPTDYVLLLLEDFFLDRAVNTAAIRNHLSTLRSLAGTALRLFPNPPGNRVLDQQPNLGVLHPIAPYRVSLQAGLWNKRKLMALLRDGESSWEFEWRGSRRSQADIAGYYCVRRALVHYRHVVERGEWFWTAARKYRREGIGCDFTARAVMSPLRALKKQLGNWARRLHNLVLSRRLSAYKPAAEVLSP